MRVLLHLRELDESIKDWERYQQFSLEELKTDRDTRNMTLHAMLVSIQAAIDISSHLISQNGLKRPATYRETFDLLAHVYWDLDLDEIYSILQNDLKTLRSFRDEIKELLSKSC